MCALVNSSFRNGGVGRSPPEENKCVINIGVAIQKFRKNLTFVDL